MANSTPFWLHCESVLHGKVSDLSSSSFRAWITLVGEAAERADTLFTDTDLAFAEWVDEDNVEELADKGLLVPEDGCWRLSAYGWSPENEDAP